ncbi:MAG: DNA/RNA non-specific endonuclease [Clostridia bacterium]|nr:DNA/RNA non-specific endonuclease [Clostridia bacterium]
MKKRAKKIYKRNRLLFVILLFIFCLCLVGMANEEYGNVRATNEIIIDLNDIPEYTDKPYIVINNNIPFFLDDEMTNISFEDYSEIDWLGRCGAAISSIGKDIMPTAERESIGSVKPSGWQTVKYDFVDGKYLYNRCHLIGYQLTAENANNRNLITGTRYLNVQGMLPFENMVADYIKETENHVLYRVTPIYEGNNLVASGVLMEAKSVEDNGEGIVFNVYCYNVQPGVKIDYATGESWLVENTENTNNLKVEYVLNTNSKKFHKLSCSGINSISDKNKEIYIGTRSVLTLQGYEPCGSCNP